LIIIIEPTATIEDVFKLKPGSGQRLVLPHLMHNPRYQGLSVPDMQKKAIAEKEAEERRYIPADYLERYYTLDAPLRRAALMYARANPGATTNDVLDELDRQVRDYNHTKGSMERTRVKLEQKQKLSKGSSGFVDLTKKD
jgi:hypothetical protein